MPAPRLHPFWRLLICAGSLAVCGVFVVAIMQTAVRWSAFATGRIAQRETAEFWSDPVNVLWATLMTYPLMLIALVVCRHTLDRRSLSSLGLQPALPVVPWRPFRSFGGGAACGALAISFLFGMLWSAGAVRIVGFSPEAFGGGTLVSAAMLTLYALLFFSVGFMEELVFRGYAFHNLRVWLGITGAIMVQAGIFAIGHAGNGGPPSWAALWSEKWAMLNLVLIAWFFATAYLKTGSLWFPIGFHAAWNFCLGCVWSLPVSGIPVFRLLDVTSSDHIALSGGKFGAEGSILLTPLIGMMLWMLHGLPDHPQATTDMDSLMPPYSDEAADEDAAVSLVEESDWPEADPNRERRYKTSMRADSEPEIERAELEKLALELQESARRAGAVPTMPPAPARLEPTMPVAVSSPGPPAEAVAYEPHVAAVEVPAVTEPEEEQPEASQVTTLTVEPPTEPSESDASTRPNVPQKDAEVAKPETKKLRW